VPKAPRWYVARAPARPRGNVQVGGGPAGGGRARRAGARRAAVPRWLARRALERPGATCASTCGELAGGDRAWRADAAAAAGRMLLRWSAARATDACAPAPFTCAHDHGPPPYQHQTPKINFTSNSPVNPCKTIRLRLSSRADRLRHSSQTDLLASKKTANTPQHRETNIDFPTYVKSDGTGHGDGASAVARGRCETCGMKIHFWCIANG
jgi:hypothetical protein